MPSQVAEPSCCTIYQCDTYIEYNVNRAPGLVLYGGLARLYDPTPDPSFKGKDNQFGLKQTTLRCSQNIQVEVSRSHRWRCTFENQQHRGLITYLLLFYLQETYILLGTRHAKMNKTPSTEVFQNWMKSRVIHRNVVKPVLEKMRKSPLWGMLN